MNADLKALIGSNIGNYLVTKYINSGSFGHVFEAKNNKTGDIVALKIPIKEKNGEKWLLEEAKVYKILNSKIKEHDDIGISKMKVIKHKNDNIIVMDLLGDSLETLLVKRKRFKLKTIILLAIQMINVLKYIHNCGYIHRDIKPDNFVIGKKNYNKLYCIDFGLAKSYIKKDDNQHIDFKDGNKFCGTARYASISAHIGHEQSRKDDLEAIGYILIYLYNGNLPWQGIKHKEKKEKYRLICEKKQKISEEELCKQLPKEFLVYLKYVRNLEFNEKPYYTALSRMFQKLYDSKKYGNEQFQF